MSNLKHWQDKIKEKRKNTDFRDFLKEIGSWNTLVFHKNNGLISKYPESNRVSKNIRFKEFEKSRDNLVKNGINYNFSNNLFVNYGKLFKETRLPNLFHVGENENCDFVDTAVNSSNSYLSNIVTLCSENVLYSLMVRENCINVLNSFYVVTNNQNIYFGGSIINSYNIFYSRYIKNSSDIWFSTNLTGCKDCILSDDLVNSSYYIKNKKYEKGEYLKLKEKILKEKNKFMSYFYSLNKIGISHNSTNSNGNFILESDNIKNGYGVFNMVNGRNIMYSGSESGGENCYDLMFGGKGTVDCYGVSNFGGNPSNVYIGYNIGMSSNIFYSYGLESCSYCIGCIGLKNKSYCILNKQYTKKEWEILSDKIFVQMEDDGILGDFFPGELNPFYFNDTVAGLIGNFTKEEVEKDGYMWRNEKIKADIPEGSEIIEASDLLDYQGFDSDGVWKINPKILKKVIKDEKGNYYRIVQMEYDFLVKHGLPLPEIHWMDRMKLNFGG